jgi:hypothetical protein
MQRKAVLEQMLRHPVLHTTNHNTHHYKTTLEPEEVINQLVAQCISNDNPNIPLSLGLIGNLSRELDRTKQRVSKGTPTGLGSSRWGPIKTEQESNVQKRTSTTPVVGYPCAPDKAEKIGESVDIECEEEATIRAYLHDPPALHVRRYATFYVTLVRGLNLSGRLISFITTCYPVQLSGITTRWRRDGQIGISCIGTASLWSISFGYGGRCLRIALSPRTNRLEIRSRVKIRNPVLTRQTLDITSSEAIRCFQN